MAAERLRRRHYLVEARGGRRSGGRAHAPIVLPRRRGDSACSADIASRWGRIRLARARGGRHQGSPRAPASRVAVGTRLWCVGFPLSRRRGRRRSRNDRGHRHHGLERASATSETPAATTPSRATAPTSGAIGSAATPRTSAATSEGWAHPSSSTSPSELGSAGPADCPQRDRPPPGRPWRSAERGEPALPERRFHPLHAAFEPRRLLLPGAEPCAIQATQRDVFPAGACGFSSRPPRTATG